jgi:prepilin-type N-terminal cleavage/methylation domain-containing protein
MPRPRSAESTLPRGAASGFTLLEIVIVLGIIGVLFGTLFAVYSSTLEISAQVDSAEERGRKARTTLSLLESDFAGIYFGDQENATSPSKEYALITGESPEDTLAGGIEQTAVGFGTTNTLEFSARFPKATPSRVRYVLRDREGEQANSATLVRMQQRLPGVRGGWSELELTDDVLEFEISFVDENGREHSQWGLEDQEATARPVMVTVALTLGRSGSWKEQYNLTVPLALR